MARQVGRHRHLHDGAHEGARRREPAPQENVFGREAQGGNRQRVPRKKIVRPSRRREMAKEVVQQRGVAIRLACAVFSISESCYRYQSQLNAKNKQIANLTGLAFTTTSGPTKPWVCEPLPSLCFSSLACAETAGSIQYLAKSLHDRLAGAGWPRRWSSRVAWLFDWHPRCSPSLSRATATVPAQRRERTVDFYLLRLRLSGVYKTPGDSVRSPVTRRRSNCPI